MKLNKKQFFEMAECWYQRTHRLRELSENVKESDKRREKAFGLFLTMAARMIKVSQHYVRINTPHPPFKKTGI